MIGYCINLLASQAWQKLGLLADPQTGEAQPDLDEAKLAIDAAWGPGSPLRCRAGISHSLRLKARPAYISQRPAP